MRVAIEVGVVTDKVVLTQALALMSFWVDGREGSENSSLLIGRAVQYVHSLGLHIQGRDDEPQTAYNETLFCCIWAIDKMNAAFHGRPVLMHDRDIDRSLQRSFDTQNSAFKLLLHVVALLDRVIELYRPGGGTEDELSGGFDTFEGLILKCDASQVSTRFLATIEILYHAVAILSCRSRPDEPKNYGPPSARIRQAFSTDKVTAMAGHEFRDQLVLLPFVPYAISLSLSVNYREMRRSKIPMSRSRAKIAFEANCQILERLGEIFWSAAAMAEMGNLTLKELDRVYAQVADADPRKPQEVDGDPQANSIPNHVGLSSEQLGNNSNNYSYTMPMPIPNEDTFNFGDLLDVDPFEMFDPTFNLDDIDACLEGNLELAMPMNIY
ncbi:hypothetical protein H2198_002547 [Neophaeococcomyces mojaviensis]|uniref:Uncharacterized protein n=1 Tax=Neophaeococcomyces mojaviensis TaxID=3383035 RepID=A0ACC3AEB0_9EURO|nr:hypothetical protein H2198_002547 [Knufia sp. JES_112]